MSPQATGLFNMNSEAFLKIIIIIIIYLNCNWVFTRGSGTTIRHNTQIHISHKITQHTQTKHSAQSYTNYKGHITHNEYNAEKKVKLYI
jgi:hypothetical protein